MNKEEALADLRYLLSLGSLGTWGMDSLTDCLSVLLPECTTIEDNPR